ncbi:N-acetylmuramoyl-L-alanine amidase [Agrilactobacillus yilanensis]|uniref:N-acetylmuramoyl-L-alanine amidase n=1 Tax=Agrilactobacillus yilanensis TaxID=2485997 RepID=A0ABW4J917_9LACO|nr:N-acetylmuramoyl-L-alanine amidase [Agrilactobacillus yilanensis]
MENKRILINLKKYFNLLLIAIALFLALGSAVVLADQNKIEVKATVVNVRTGPGLSYDILDKVKSGTQLDVISQKNGWYQVRLDKAKIGWVAGWLLNSTEIGLNSSNKVGKINTTNVSIYQQASTTAAVLDTATVNQTVTILYTTNGWTQVKYNNIVGWVQSNTLNTTNATDDNATQNTAIQGYRLTTKQADTKLRKTANMNGAIVATLDNDTPLTYIKSVGQWYQAKTNDGQVGYVANWVVTKTAVAEIVKPTSLAKATIVLDPGHGGSDSGALSNSGQYEKKYTLAVAQQVASRLREAGANVIMTRSSDQSVSLAKRPQISNNTNADAFISFHFDSTESSNDASGITTYYYSKSKDSPLAKDLSQQLSSLPLTNKGTQYGDYQVLRDNVRPSVLLELGYINTKKDFSKISSTSYQEAIADAVYKALNQYFS